MFGSIRRVLGNIKVTQTNKDITIDGIPADVMTKDIARIWRTSRINANMFSRASKNSLTFPLFFAPDMLYMLESMCDTRSRNVSVRTLSKIRDLLLRDTWLADTQVEPKPRMEISRLRNMIYSPKDYQQTFFENYDRLTQQYHLNGYLLAATAGSGKTYMTLALAECLRSDLIVIVCPKNATERVWEAEIKKLFKKVQTYWIHQHGKPYVGQRFAVFHYEALKDALAMAESGMLKGESVMVILDECHNLNDVGSVRTGLYLSLVAALKAMDILPASGTAVKAMGTELIPLLTSIDPYFTDDARERYKRIYGRDGNRGVDILNHRMGLVSYKVEKHQLGLAKPIPKELRVKIPNGKDYTLENIRIDMSRFIDERFAYYKARRPQDQKLYDECLALHKASLRSPAQLNEFQQYKDTVKVIQRFKGDARQVGAEIKWSNVYEKQNIHPSLPQALRNDFKDVKSVIKYVNLKIQGEALGRILGRKRIQCHVDMVPHIDFKSVCESTTKKTVVFTSFVEALEASDKILTAQGMNPLTVYGKTNNDLNKTIRSFENNEDLNPLLATFQSLSTAVPLVMADTMIMIDSPFRSYIREQAISRIHRLGADTQTVVYEASLDTGDEPNISTRSSDILAWSQAQVTAILGVESPFEVTASIEGLSVSAEDFGLEEFYTDPTFSPSIGLEAIMTEW